MITPRERYLQTLKTGKADRVPLELPGFQHKSQSQVDGLEDPLRKEIAGRLFDGTHYFMDHPSGINRYLVTPDQFIETEEEVLANGDRRIRGVIPTRKGDLTFVTIESLRHQTSWLVKNVVESRDDLKKLASVPWELPELLRNFSKDAPDDRGIVKTHLSSPAVCVSTAMGYEMFLELCATDLDLVKEMTEICKERILNCVRVLASRQTIDIFWIGGSEWVTPPMASVAIYDALVQEQEREIIDLIHRQSGGFVHIHCHGRVREALTRMIARGGNYTEPVEPPPDGDITMQEAKELAAGRIVLGGNIECRVLAREPEKVVETAAREAFLGGKEHFILRTTEGPSPVLSRQEHANYMRLIDVWEELSPM
jgi:hypothetical protein